MSLICLNGNCVVVDKKYLEGLTPGVLKDRGGFETFLVKDQKIVDYERHLLRLKRTLKLLKIKSPRSISGFKKNIFKLCQKNKLSQTAVRLMVWQDKKKVQSVIVCLGFSEALSRKFDKGIKLAISNIVRKQTKFSHVKTLDYYCFAQAFKEAQKKKMDDALLLNTKGFIVESARANIFFVKNKRLFTPSVQSGCLNGITRQRVLRCSKKMGVVFKVGFFRLNDLRSADEIFLTNSVRGVIPVCVFEKKSFGNSQEQKITTQLKNAYEDCSCGDISV